MGEQTQGRRIPQPPAAWNGEDYPDNPDGVPWKPGDYWRSAWGGWECCTPNGLHASLRGHDVTEHGDGTITVSPSILTKGGGKEWHGHLRNGVWEEC